MFVVFTVSAIQGGQPAVGVAGVEVMVRQNPSKHVVTDARGNFAIDALPAGSYTLAFRAQKAKDSKTPASKVTIADSYSIKIEGTKRPVNQSGLTSNRLLGGLDIAGEVGSAAKIRGQVLAGGTKKMVWIAAALGSNVPGHWAEEGSKEASAYNRVQISNDDVRNNLIVPDPHQEGFGVGVNRFGPSPPSLCSIRERLAHVRGLIASEKIIPPDVFQCGASPRPWYCSQMKTMIRIAAVSLLCLAAGFAYGSVPVMNVSVSDASGKAAFKGVTNSKGTFATANLKPGSYVVQINSKSAAKGTFYAVVVSAGKKKVSASAVPGEKFAGGGVALKVDVGAGLNISGQVAAEERGATKNGKKMVWIAPQLGSNMPGHWVAEDSPEAIAAKNAGTLSTQDVSKIQERMHNPGGN